MKTNNRLSKDNNTHEPKVRPMVKVVEYEYENVYGDKEWYKQGLFPFAETTKPTTRVREVERPMNDTEYIEYLEKEIQELKNTYELILDSRDKEILELKAVNKELVNKFINQQDQFLKIVESVLFIHILDFNLSCMNKNCNHNGYTYREHLLQEIKSAIQKDL